MIFNQIHHVAIIVSDYEKSKDFYVNKLGFEILRENVRAKDIKLDLKLNDCELEIFCPNNLPPERVNNPEASGLRHLAFRVDDVESAKAELEKLGIECEPVRVDSFTNGKFTFFKDPDNLPLEIHE